MCNLCDALQKEKDKILFQNHDIFVIPTKDMKGHHKRIMVISKKHLSYNQVPNRKSLQWVSELIKFSMKYFDEEPTYALCESTYCTIPDHWHKIACDWFGTSEEITQLHYTSHIACPTEVKWKPKEEGGV